MNSIMEETTDDEYSTTSSIMESGSNRSLHAIREESTGYRCHEGSRRKTSSSFSSAFSFFADKENADAAVNTSSSAIKNIAFDSSALTPSGLRKRRTSTVISPSQTVVFETPTATPEKSDVIPATSDVLQQSPHDNYNVDKTPKTQNTTANSGNEDADLPSCKSATSLPAYPFWADVASAMHLPVFHSPPLKIKRTNMDNAAASSTNTSSTNKKRTPASGGGTAPATASGLPVSWPSIAETLFVNWIPGVARDNTSNSSNTTANEQQQRFGSPATSSYNAPTPLHQLCHDACSVDELSDYASQNFPSLHLGQHQQQLNTKSTACTNRQRGGVITPSFLTCVTATDETGRLPLHVLSDNSRLIRNNFGCNLDDLVYYDDYHGLHQRPLFASPIKIRSSGSSPTTRREEHHHDIKTFALDFVKQLVKQHPAALGTADTEGHLPFMRSIVRWIDFIYNNTNNNHNYRHQISYKGDDDNVVSNEANLPRMSMKGVTSGISKTLSFAGATGAINKSASINSFTSGTGASPTSNNNGSSSNHIPTSNSSRFASLERVFNNCVISTNINNMPKPQSTNDSSFCAENGQSSSTPKSLQKKRGMPSRMPGRSDSESSWLSHYAKTTSHSDTTSSRDKMFPKRVFISPHVEWCLHMLSGIIDCLEDDNDEISLAPRMPPLSSTSSAATAAASDRKCQERKNSLEKSRRRIVKADTNTGNRMITFLQGSKATICENIVHSLASIPFLIKTLLLIDDETKRGNIFKITVIRRVVLDNHSIGKWLSSMLLSDRKQIAQRALNYLDLLSDASEDETTDDVITRDAKKKKREDLYEAVAQLDSLIPSMIDLDEYMQEQAATSKIVRRVMDKMISRPFAVIVVFFDMLFLAMLIACFRFSVHGFLNAKKSLDVMRYVFFAKISLFYFVIRELGHIISLLMIAKNRFRHFLSFWNIVDIMSVILTLSSIHILRRCLARVGSCSLDASRWERSIFALSTGLLWLRVLGLLKTINKQLATFVLAVIQITRDILWFLVILTAVVVSFAQMFYTLLVPATCAKSTNDKECNQTDYYMKSYTVLLGGFGGFERSNFNTPEAAFLSVVFTFFVVIILLNILIAIVGDSYEKCLLRSESLFGRARIVLLAKLGSSQQMLARKSKVREEEEEDNTNVTNEQPKQRSIKNCFAVSFFSHLIPHKSLTKGGQVFIFLSSSILLSCAFWEIYEPPKPSDALYAILVYVLLLCGIILFLKESSESSNNYNEGLRAVLVAWYNRSIQKLMYRLLGNTSGEQANGSIKSFTIEHEWQGRLHHIEKELSRATAESAAKTKAELGQLSMEMRQLMVATEQTVVNTIAQVNVEMKTEMDEMKSEAVEIRKLFAATESKMMSEIAQVKTDIAQINGNILMILHKLNSDDAQGGALKRG